MHRLVLFTSAYEQLARGVPLDQAALQALTQATEGLSFEVPPKRKAHARMSILAQPQALDAKLQVSLHTQLRTIAHAVHGAMDSLPPPPQATTPKPTPDSDHPPTRRSGLSFAVDARPPPAAPDVAQQALQHAFHKAMGFHLEVAPSAVGHHAAGDGVWLCGSAAPGQVVALYPGLVYPPSELRYAHRLC